MRALVLALLLLATAQVQSLPVTDPPDGPLPGDSAFSNWVNRFLGIGPKDYGSWKCFECYLPPPGTHDSSQAIPEVIAFIAQNNNDIHKEEGIKARWVPNSLITICNQTWCVTVRYFATGTWLPTGPAKPYDGRTLKVPTRPSVPIFMPSVLFDGPVWTGYEIVSVTVAVSNNGPLDGDPGPEVEPSPDWAYHGAIITRNPDGTVSVTYESPADGMPTPVAQELQREVPPSSGDGLPTWGGGGGGGCVPGYDPDWMTLGPQGRSTRSEAHRPLLPRPRVPGGGTRLVGTC